LDFITACQQTITEMVGYKYSYEIVSAVAEDLNHGAGDGSHFYLLPTLLLENNLNEGLIDYFQNINHILDYGVDPKLPRGIKAIVIRSYNKYTQISSDNTVQVTTTSNIFSAMLSQIAILMEQEDLTNAYLLDEKKNKEVAVEQKKEIIAINVEEIPPKQYESAGNVTITNEEIEFKKKQSEFLMQQVLNNILLLQGGVGDSNQIMQNIFMLTNTFMNNNQSILKNNKKTPKKITNNDNNEKKNYFVSDPKNIKNKKKTKKTPKKKRK